MKFVNISKRYGEHVVFDRFSLSVRPGSIMAIVGPSGMGKTTLLHIASDLVDIDEGEVVKEPSETGAVSYLFQEPRLLAHETVYRNVELALHKDYPEKADRRNIALQYLSLVGLDPFLSYYPKQLSGGMRQRVAIARAFAHPAHLLLMDEPFQSLDIRLRYALLHSFVDLWEGRPRTTLFVTHDPKEAVLVGDAVCCLGENPLSIQIDTPRNARSVDDADLLAIEARLVRALTT